MSSLKDLAAFLKTVPDGFSKWELELAYCLVILKRCDGNRVKAAKLLKISLRSLSSYVSVIMDLVDDCPISLAGVKRYTDLTPVLAALIRNGGRRIVTARELGISTTTLLKYCHEMKALGMSVPKAPAPNASAPRPKKERKAIVRRYTRNFYS